MCREMTLTHRLIPLILQGFNGLDLHHSGFEVTGGQIVAGLVLIGGGKGCTFAHTGTHTGLRILNSAGMAAPCGVESGNRMRKKRKRSVNEGPEGYGGMRLRLP